MRRLVDHWWLVGSALLIAVIVLTVALYAGESDRHGQQQRGTEHQAVASLSTSVNDLLAREVVLARVADTLPDPLTARWRVLSDIVMSQTPADSAAFIQPVAARDRSAFERRTGLRLVESPTPGLIRNAAQRPMHLVISAYRRLGPGRAPLGLDLAANPLRRTLLLDAARTGKQLASPPVEFLTRTEPTRGVVAYVAVRGPDGHLRGWVSAAYETRQLAAIVTARMPDVHLTIRDGATTLVPGPRGAGLPRVIPVAGRRWSVWATVRRSPISAIPWLTLSLGLALTAVMMLILRRAASGARRSTAALERRDAEEAAISRITTLVAQGQAPDVVFKSVAEQVAALLDSCTAAVSRFDVASNEGTVLGGWSDEGLDLTSVPFALDGVTASARVFQTGRPARTEAGYASTSDPIAAMMSSMRSKDGVAAPITVAGKPWGALGAAYRENLIPGDAEVRLSRFASLVGLAISNTDARDRLERQASTDPLTGIANRRTFRERLTEEIARGERYGRHLSLALIDLDHFKAVNDAHGHAGGDRVLVLFAQLLSVHSREGEIVARIGGEEFAWLMPETDEHGARIAADRVREAVETTPFEDIGRVTLSAGVCSTERAHGADALMGDADRALYWAKDSGRNMTMVFTGETPGRATVAGIAAPGVADQ